MVRILFSLLVLFSFAGQAMAACTAYCRPGVSYACGQGCVSVYKQCRKPTTTACNGERPPTASKYYPNPKKVEPKLTPKGDFHKPADEKAE